MEVTIKLETLDLPKEENSFVGSIKTTITEKEGQNNGNKP